MIRQSGRKLSPRACSTSAYRSASRGRRPVVSSRSRREAKTHSEQEQRELPSQSPAPGIES
ncbi:hypothetical protein ASR50_00375 [Streptomyces sp. 4F]|nr:hypothetical protein ASR50_00375 [Streptomyces sp. 4F]